MPSNRSRSYPTRRLVAVAIVGVAVSACTGGTGSVGRGLDDSSAALAIKSRMLRSSTDFRGVDVNVTAGLVLLTGSVATPEHRVEAERIAWSAPKVREVANELSVGAGDQRQMLGANDQWISAQVRSRLLADAGVRGSTINVETHSGVVYLLGRARTAGEAERAAANASLVPGVTRVISYLEFGDPAAPSAEPRLLGGGS